VSERMWSRGPKEKPAVSEVAVPPRQPLADLKWYGVAALCFGVAFAAALIFDRFRFGEAAIPLLALGCAIASWYGGRGPALAAVVLSSLAFAYFFLEPRGHWSLRPSEVPSFITFVLFATVVSWFGAVRRRAEADQKRAAESLRRTTAYVADSQKLARIGVWAADRNSKPIYWSEELYRIFGFDPKQGLPTTEQALERIHPEDHDKFRRATISEKGCSNGQYRIVLRDGTVKHVHGSAHPVLDRNGKIVEVVGVIVDITERKHADAALKESEANLNRAQEIAHVGSWHLDIARDRLVWSDEVFRIFDKPLGTPLTYEDFLAMVHPGDRERVDRAWMAALRGAPYDIEHRILAGNELKWVRERAALEFDARGNAVKGIGTVQETTERSALKRFYGKVRLIWRKPSG
jgi:PAS domain S-box-containing protein